MSHFLLISKEKLRMRKSLEVKKRRIGKNIEGIKVQKAQIGQKGVRGAGRDAWLCSLYVAWPSIPACASNHDLSRDAGTDPLSHFLIKKTIDRLSITFIYEASIP